jgi:hypothetical protein
MLTQISEDIHGALVKSMNRSLLIVIIGTLNFRKREHLIRVSFWLSQIEREINVIKAPVG